MCDTMRVLVALRAMKPSSSTLIGCLATTRVNECSAKSQTVLVAGSEVVFCDRKDFPRPDDDYPDRHLSSPRRDSGDT